jgi:hypothetical protein
METQLSRRTSHPPEAITRLQRELSDQLDGVVDFADLCAYLTPAIGDDRARVLIDLAQGLYDETLRVLEQRGAEIPDLLGAPPAPPAAS